MSLAHKHAPQHACRPGIVLAALAALAVLAALSALVGARGADAGPAPAAEPLRLPAAWTLSRPLIAPVQPTEGEHISVKDPSVVFHEGKWHVFMTIRGRPRSHEIQYVAFEQWEEADKAPRAMLTIEPGYYCAPQVFYFRPHRKWYLIYQTGRKGRRPGLQPTFATTETLGDPASWVPGGGLWGERDLEATQRAIDFWVICDAERAYLFFTSNNGHMWRMSTPLAEFPDGFRTAKAELALKADIFEAGHTYSLLGRNEYLTVVEAQGPGGRRYYKAYLADRLDGAWRPLADTWERPFAGEKNVRQPAPAWADDISHGELLRTGADETLPVDPANLRFLIQGVTQRERAGKAYGDIPWRLGLLTPASAE
ncbi:MAG: glycoside hydrolase [Planctomycetes bacterium]|nr:glycoside hydrolase [Planctomycetota bacterium]